MQAPLTDDGVRNCSSMDPIALFGLPLSRARSLEHAFDLVRAFHNEARSRQTDNLCQSAWRPDRGRG